MELQLPEQYSQVRIPEHARNNPKFRTVIHNLFKKINSNHPFYTWEPHKKQRDFLRSRAQIRGAVGANRVGKTEVIAYIAIAQCLGFDPALTRMMGHFVFHKTPSKVWVSTLDHKLSREVVAQKVRKFLPPGEARFSARDAAWVFKNESRLVFKSCKSGYESYMGDEVDLICNDEEPGDERIFNEQVMRILSVAGKIAFSFTPLRGSLWLHDVLFYPEESGFLKKNVFTIQIGMVDNPYLPRGTIEAARRRYSGDEAKIRIDGEYVVSMGNRVFDGQKLLFQRHNAIKDYFKGDLVEDELRGSFRLKKDRQAGCFHIFRYPKAGQEYAIGVDVADGDPLGDFSVICVMECETQEQVAIWRGRIDPSELGHIVNDIGRYYGDALVGIERNRAGTATISVLKDRTYPRLYAMPDHLKMKKRTSENPASDASMLPTKFGWETNRNSKPHMIADLKYDLDNDMVRIHCDVTLSEMSKFAYLKEETKSALHNLGPLKGHDDCVMALGVCHQVVKSTYTITTGRPVRPKKKTIEDKLWEMTTQKRIAAAFNEEDDEINRNENYLDLLL